MLAISSVSQLDVAYYAGARAEGLSSERFGEVGPRWIGRGATGRFEGPVTEVALASMAAGFPSSDAPASLAGPTRRVEVIDLVFAAPKAVSIVALALDGDEGREVVAAHRDSVSAAVGYLEERGALTRRGSDWAAIATTGITAAGFTHGLSRGGDPHLHDHVLVANLVHGSNGRFGPLDGRALRAHRHVADALYQAQLRHELTSSLGICFEHRSDGTTGIVGLDRFAEVALSTRSAQRREVGAFGERDPKSVATTLDDHRARWHERANVLDVDLSAISLDRSTVHHLDHHLDERAFATALLGGGEPVTGRAVLAAWCRAARPGVRVGEATATMDVLVEQWRSAAGSHDVTVAPSQIIPTARSRAQFGPRPLSPSLLRSWVDLSHQLDSRRSRELGIPSESEFAPRDLARGALDRARNDGRG